METNRDGGRNRPPLPPAGACTSKQHRNEKRGSIIMATTRNKVMWQEGMLMRPHHFQQQQRYNDYLDNQRFRAMN
ncbi:type VI secretion system baseplate subunit TssK, partial [Escherichia coli]|nr:type VI secretion system baseplate subunit TssK [Escherichia coli]